MNNSKPIKIKYIPITREHIALRVKWIADPEINKFLATFTRNDLNEKFHQTWFDKYEEKEKKGNKKIFIIEVDGVSVGQVGFSDINKDDKNAELYIVIGEKDYWGKGIGTKAIEFIHDYAFNKLRLHKINLSVHSNNSRAIALYKKIGYQVVGVYHDNIYWDGEYDDETIMEIIKE